MGHSTTLELEGSLEIFRPNPFLLQLGNPEVEGDFFKVTQQFRGRAKPGTKDTEGQGCFRYLTLPVTLLIDHFAFC